MADRYWVGGTASWDGTAGTKWATTSGGTGGASVPNTNDDVFFDANSTGTITVATGNLGAKSITCTGFTGTITGTANISLVNNLTLSAGMTYTHTGLITIIGDSTLTTFGKSVGDLRINGNGITVQLADALTTTASRNLTIDRGTFITNDYAVSVNNFSSDSTSTRTINFGSSAVTVRSSGLFLASTGLTFNAGSSTISFTQASGTLQGAGQTFHNVSFTSATTGTRSITGANTFNNLLLAASATGISQLALSANQTVNGTFTCAGYAVQTRAFVRSDTLGTPRTITANAISANDCDFRDITIAGSAAGASPTRAGDCGGNSGVTFPVAKTVYRVSSNTSWATSSGWADTSGGTGDVAQFPLPQDTVVVDNSTLATSLSTGGYNVGSIDCSSRTTSFTLNHNNAMTLYGNYTLGSGITISGTNGPTFSGRGTQTFTSAGKTITFPLTVDKPSGTFQLGDAYNASNIVTLTQGTFSAGTYNVTCTRFNSSTSFVRTLNMGSGLWTLTGTGTGTNSVWNLGTNLVNMTFNKDSANILFSDTSTSTREFRGAAQSYNKFTIGGATGTSEVRIVSNPTFTELASTKTVAHTISFDNSGGVIGTWSVTGSAGNVVTVNSTTAGNRRTFNITNVTSGIDYLAVQDIGVNQANTFYVGANSTDLGNNNNVIFTAAPAPSASNSNFFLMFA